MRAFNRTNFPGAHPLQSLLDAMPGIELYLPLSQDSQPFCELLPTIELKVPDRHLLHCVRPLMLVHSPAGHGKQCEDLLEADQEPTGQSKHLEDPTGLLLPGGHHTQLFIVVDPNMLLAVPAVQERHDDLPSVLANFPASQSWQLR